MGAVAELGCGIHRVDREKERENHFSLIIFRSCTWSCTQHCTYGRAVIAIFHLLQEAFTGGKNLGVPGWFLRLTWA